MDFKKIIPHLIAVGILLAVSALFFAPNAFSGKVLPQPDNDKARGMSTEIQRYIQEDGHGPLWTNAPFAGMPSFQIYTTPHGNLTKPFFKSLFLWTDYTSVWAQVFVAMFCLYLLLGAWKTDWRVAIFGALAFGITTYNIDILEAGHSTKMMALAMTPGVLAGVVWAFQGRWLLGGGLTALFLAMQVYANHLQITYYTLLLTGVYLLVQLVEATLQKTLASWTKAFAITGLAIVLGFGSNLSKLWPTYEFGQETIRGGGSELKSKAGQGTGLAKDYAFSYSYGILESFTLLVPHYAGGGANETYKNTQLYKSFTTKYREQVPAAQASQQAGSLLYSGAEGVGTAIYFGSIVCFLFLLGAFLVPGSAKWWLVSSALLMISISWAGRFFVNTLFFDYLPMFNKFRALSMALGLGQLCFAALAALGLQKVVDPDIVLSRKKQAFYIAAGTTALLLLIAWATSGPSAAALQALANTPDLLANLRADHAATVRGDVLRSFGFVAIAAVLLWFYLQGKLKAGLLVGALALFALADQWLVCSRTISAEKYEAKRSTMAPPAEAEYDQQIKQDADPHYRVLDLARGSLTGNATASYFHKSMSGYSAAKLQRYQDVIDSFLNKDVGKNLHIVGMFNGKYLVSPQGEVVPNPEACGNAWFVRSFDVAPSADAELTALHTLQPKTTAVVQSTYAGSLQGLNIQFDSANSIRLTKYHPDKMEYEYTAKTEQLALFSEIYYPPAKGWKTYINGQPAPDFIKANYLLRAMRLPAGQQMKLEMRFEPRSWYLGETVSLVASALTILLFLGGLFWWFRRHGLEDPNRLTDIERKAPITPSRPPARTAPAPPVKGKVPPKGKR